MNIFLAWSGRASHQLALRMREWLPSIIQSIEPFLSSEDIGKGQKWASEVGAKLDDTHCALLCLTPTNLDSTWIHFEAGAVLKKVGQAHVSGLLLDVNMTQIQFPLQQFQHTALTRDDLWKLMKDLNKLCAPSLEESRLLKYFNQNYPELENGLVDVRKTLVKEQEGRAKPQRKTDDILADILSTQQAMASRLEGMDKRSRQEGLMSLLQDVPNVDYQALLARLEKGRGKFAEDGAGSPTPPKKTPGSQDGATPE